MNLSWLVCYIVLNFPFPLISDFWLPLKVVHISTWTFVYHLAALCINFHHYYLVKRHPLLVAPKQVYWQVYFYSLVVDLLRSSLSSYWICLKFCQGINALLIRFNRISAFSFKGVLSWLDESLSHGHAKKVFFIEALLFMFLFFWAFTGQVFDCFLVQSIRKIVNQSFYV